MPYATSRDISPIDQHTQEAREIVHNTQQHRATQKDPIPSLSSKNNTNLDSLSGKNESLSGKNYNYRTG